MFEGWSHHQGLHPLLFSNSGVGSFYIPQEPDKYQCCVMGRTIFCPYLRRLESLTANADVISKAALSFWLFIDPECWSSWSSNLRPPAPQTGALPTELTIWKESLYLQRSNICRPARGLKYATNFAK